MKALLPLLVIDLLLFTALGIAVIAWLPRPWCGHLLVGASALGAVKIDNHVLAVSPSPDDPRPLSVLVEAVRAG